MTDEDFQVERTRLIHTLLAKCERLEAELVRLRRGPAALIQQHTGKWHAFERREDAITFERTVRIEGGYTSGSVHSWIWHEAATAEGGSS